MLAINGQPLLQHQLHAFKQFNITDVTLVRGHHKEAIQFAQTTSIDNDDYDHTTEVFSLYLAKAALTQQTIVTYGDILFKEFILHECLASQHDIVLVVDPNTNKSGDRHDWIQASQPYDVNQFQAVSKFVALDRTLQAAQRHGEFIGVMYMSQKGAQQVQSVLAECGESYCKTAAMGDLLAKINEKMPIHIGYIEGGWTDVNTLADLQLASNFYA